MLTSIRNRLIIIGLMLAAAVWSLWPRRVTIRQLNAQGVMADTTVDRTPLKLGLDLQGGIHLALEVDQSKARALGVDSQLLGNTLQTLLSGVVVTQYREGTESIDVVARAVPSERLSVEGL